MAKKGPPMPHAEAVLDFVSAIIADIREKVVEEPWYGRIPDEFFVDPSRRAASEMDEPVAHDRALGPDFDI